jgi:hypothetical protein
VLHLHGMPPGSEECQMFLSLCRGGLESSSLAKRFRRPIP